MVSLIVVDYRSMPKTVNYIKSCYGSFATVDTTHAIIVDNAEDSSVGLSYLREQCRGNVQLIKEDDLIYLCELDGRSLLYVAAGENLGYAKGNNLGAQVAAKVYQDAYYLFSNNDLAFPEGFQLEALMKPFQDNPKVAVVGPKVMTPEGEQQSPRIAPKRYNRLFRYYWDLVLPKGHKMGEKVSDIDTKAHTGICDWVPGSFMLVDAGKFHEVGMFDPYTFLFYEEVILAARLQKMGYQMYYTDGVTILHAHGETVKSVLSAIRSIDISFKSTIYYFKRYDGTFPLLIWMAYGNYGICRTLFILKKRLGNLLGKH